MAFQLPTLPPADPHPDWREFASAKFPLRPSKLIQFIRCPMSAFLSIHDGENEAGEPAQTGNLVHSAAAAYHRLKAAGTHTDAQRLEAGLAALEAARQEFPEGNPEKAVRIFRSYASDPENIKAETPWVEQKVVIELEPAPNDPTRQPVVIIGTLDQIRRYPDGSLRLWDIKTGNGKDPVESVNEYLIQQAAYLLAAREKLDPRIMSGGLLYTPGYEKPRGRRHLPIKTTPEQAALLLVPVVYAVAEIRRGIPAFRPGADSCKHCPHRPYSQCLPMLRGLYP